MAPARKTVPGFSDRQRRFKAAAPSEPPVPERLDLQLGPGGRVVIPAVFRKAMHVKDGDRLMARVVDGELRLITPQMAIKRAQQMVRETIPADADLIADLFEMRRREVADEFGEDG